VTPQQAIEILRSEPVIVIDDESQRAWNAEDSDPGAVVVLSLWQRNEIVKLLQSIESK